MAAAQHSAESSLVICSCREVICCCKQTMLFIPPSAPLTSTAVASATAGTPHTAALVAPAPTGGDLSQIAPVDTVHAARHPQQSMVLIPTSSPVSSTALTTANSSASGAMRGVGQPPQTSNPHNVHEGEGEEGWLLVTRSLMVVVMENQPSATAASTLLGVFRPMVDGWVAARKDARRWKERAAMYTAEHEKQKIELVRKHDTLQAQIEGLQQSLAESQGKARELESHESTVRAKISSLEKKLHETEAQARAADDAHAQAAQENKKEVEAIAKSSQEAKMMYEKLRQETDNKTRSYNADITKLQNKIKELEATKVQLEERLGTTISKSTSVEEQLAQKAQDITNLQTRITELTTRKETLERQLQLYQRIPTRRF